MRSTVLLDPARLERADTTTQREPFPFMVAHGQLPPEAHTDLDRDFPRYSSAGFFPYDPGDCGPAINTLIDNLTSREFASVIGQHVSVNGTASEVVGVMSVKLGFGTPASLSSARARATSRLGTGTFFA